MSDVQWHKTACNLCYVNCGIEVAIENGRMGKVRGDRSNPKSQGYLCNKAARIPYSNGRRLFLKRLRTPPTKICALFSSSPF